MPYWYPKRKIRTRLVTPHRHPNNQFLSLQGCPRYWSGPPLFLHSPHNHHRHHHLPPQLNYCLHHQGHLLYLLLTLATWRRPCAILGAQRPPSATVRACLPCNQPFQLSSSLTRSPLIHFRFRAAPPVYPSEQKGPVLCSLTRHQFLFREN